jgi:hypothetical protein
MVHTQLYFKWFLKLLISLESTSWFRVSSYFTTDGQSVSQSDSWITYRKKFKKLIPTEWILALWSYLVSQWVSQSVLTSSPFGTHDLIYFHIIAGLSFTVCVRGKRTGLSVEFFNNLMKYVEVLLNKPEICRTLFRNHSQPTDGR